MSRESKIITVKDFSTEKTIYNYESFGWELLFINGNQLTMSRETQNPVYNDLVKYQGKYEDLYAKFKSMQIPKAPAKPEPVNILLLLMSLICFVIPCIAYTTYLIVQHKKYKAAHATYVTALAAYNEERAKILAEMDATALDSRVTFFSKQS